MKNKRTSNKKKSRGGKKSSGGQSNGSRGSSSKEEASAAAQSSTKPPRRPASDGADAEESTLLVDLSSRARSLLASVGGCAPDGAPLALPDHPLGRLHASVVELTNELIRLQSDRTSGSGKAELASSNVGSRDDPRTWEEFSLWLSRCGIDPISRDFPVEIRQIAPCSSDDGDGIGSTKGYGLFATRDVAYDETVLEIPVEAMVCPYWSHLLDRAGATGDSDGDDGDRCGPNRRGAQPPPPFDASRSKEEDEPARPLCLATYLANERWRGDRSPYKPYLDSLPRTYSTPLFWSLDETRELARTSHLKRAATLQALTIWEYLQMRDMIERAHNNNAPDGAFDDLIPVEDFTYELFRWATVTAHTRQNLIPFSVSSSRIARPGGGEGGEIQTAYGLVPLWDLFNHEDSDRACVTSVAVVGDGGGVGESDAEKRPRQGILVCRTPSNPEGANGIEEEGGVNGKKICFRRGEEITMHYGERSNAQLLFHSGFLNGGGDKSGEGMGKNWNRKDHALLRVALPTAERDGGLDRIREMIAARFGFKAYVGQGCQHDGMLCADAAATVISDQSDGESSKVDQLETSRKHDEVLMTEISVSPRDPIPDDLKRALLLCIGNKEELAHLLRNQDQYLASRSTINCTDGKKTSGSVDGEVELLRLGEKHLQLASKLVGIQNDRYQASERSVDRKSAKGGKLLAADLACCDSITLNSWLESFRSLHGSC